MERMYDLKCCTVFLFLLLLFLFFVGVEKMCDLEYCTVFFFFFRWSGMYDLECRTVLSFLFFFLILCCGACRGCLYCAFGFAFCSCEGFLLSWVVASVCSYLFSSFLLCLWM